MSVEFERGKVYTIDRGGPQIGTGQGMLKGLAIVWSHFLDSLTKKLTKPDEISGVFTVPYPEERLDYPETFRSFPILLYDDATGQDLCTSCFQCERICPPQVIHITQAKDPVTGKAVPAAQAFDLEYDACMSCSLCAEVCPFDAIKMDQDFELSTDLRAGLTIHKEGLVRPVSYYEKLAPTLWAEVSAGAMKKLQGAIKRRPAGIGQSSEPTGAAKVETAPTGAGLPPEAGGRPRAPEPVVATRPAQAAPAPRPAAPISATPAAQPAASAGLPPEAGGAVQDTKAAKLAAIRAANAAKKAAEDAADQNEPSS